MMNSLHEYNNDTGPSNVITLSTTAGVRLNAIWKQRKDKWYIVDLWNNVVDILTPRQFQDAVENGKYFFK
jgi:hypothetical protein